MKTKKLLSVLLTIIMIFSTMAAFGVNASAMQVFVNDGEIKYTLDTEPSDTIEYLKAKLADKVFGDDTMGYRFELYFAGRLLEDDGTLADNGIESESTLQVLVDGTWLDLETSTTDILEKKELDQNYNLTVSEGDKDDVTKVKLTWEISDINATRTDNMIWDTDELEWVVDTSNTSITDNGTATFTLENYSSVKVDAEVTFDTAEYEEGKKFAAPTLTYNEGTNTAGTDDGKITLDTANGSSTYSKTNVPTGVIAVTVTPDDTDAAFKALEATTAAARYGTYTVTIGKSNAAGSQTGYTITIDETILSVCSLDEGCPTTIAPNGTATLTFTAKQDNEGGGTYNLNSTEISVENADYEGDNWEVSEDSDKATLVISNPTGDVTVSGSQCLAAGTKITMADGSLKNIEDITIGEEVLSFDHETGEYEARAVYVAYAGAGKNCGTELSFSDGTALTIVGEHDLFEKESMKYVTLTRTNAQANIGRHYYNAETGEFIELTGVNTTDAVNYYSIYVKNSFNCIANGMLTVPADVDYLLNLYQFNDDLTADKTALEKDIETYGLYEYRADAPYSKDEYDMLNMKYVNILLGKGMVTMNDLCGDRDLYLAAKE